MTPPAPTSTGLVEPATTGSAPRPQPPRGPASRIWSLAQMLADDARRLPNRTMFTALDREGATAETRTAAELDADARRLASALLAIAAPGDRVLVPAMPGLGFHKGFLACLYAGLVAVPVPPIRVGGLKQRDPRGTRRLGRLTAICADASPLAAVVPSAQLNDLRDLLDAATEHSALAGLHLLAADVDGASSLGSSPQQDSSLPGLGEVDPAAPAFLQYTSGSTSAPRGVVVTHRAMMANQRAISERYAIGHESTCVSWLPLYHDMGLCAGLLQPLYTGGDGVVMEPETFLVRPERWLEALSGRTDTVSAAPDFAYQLVTARLTPEVKGRLDLSGWRMALCGAEPVKPLTIRMFNDALADCGLRATALTPAYGLAESTLFVSGNDVDDPAFVERFDREALGRGTARRTSDPSGVELVGAGRPHDSITVAVVDPDSFDRLPDGRVGELWVRSESNGAGYWGQTEDSRAVFEAEIHGESGEGWLRTGDLGFFDDGELVVTGRLKDLVIIRGVNYYPQDFERIVQEAHPALCWGLAAAFADESNSGRVQVVVEADRRTPQAELAEAASTAVRAVTTELPVQVEVLVVDRGQVPRTTSGKVRRKECAMRIRQDQVSVLAGWPRHG
jgi:acyl-CoA synthetase (AMP-forming)/AMP-acid ligase II